MTRETLSALDAVSDTYHYGFETDIDADTAPKGLNEDIIRFISAKKKEPEWLLDFRLKAYRHWLTMTEPRWAKVDYPPIDYQDIYYYAAPKTETTKEIDPELMKTYEKLGVPLRERDVLAGVAVDAATGWRSRASSFRRFPKPCKTTPIW